MGVSLEFKGGAHVVGEVAEVLRIGREPRSYGNAVGESVASARRNGSGASVPAHADRDVEFLDVVRLHQASEGGVGGETTFKLLVHLVDAVVDVLHSRVLKLLQFVDFHSMAINGRADRAQFVGVAFESLAVFNDGPFGGRHAVVDCTDLLVGLGNGSVVLLVGIGQGFDCGIMLLVGFSQARNGGTVFNDGPFGGRHAVVDCTDLLVGLDNGLFVDFNVVLVSLSSFSILALVAVA